VKSAAENTVHQRGGGGGTVEGMELPLALGGSDQSATANGEKRKEGGGTHPITRGGFQRRRTHANENAAISGLVSNKAQALKGGSGGGRDKERKRTEGGIFLQ